MELSAASGRTMFQGEREARAHCEAFLHENMGLLYRVAASYEAVPARREDLLQDIVMALWQAAPRFQGRASFKTFALRVAHNRALTHCAREARRPTSVALDDQHPDPAADPARQVESSLRQERLMAAVRELPLAQRQIIGLALEGLTYNEIADVLDITTNNVGVRLNRAKKRLMESFDG